MAEGDMITEDDLVFSSIENRPEITAPGDMTLGALEKKAILAVIKKNKGNISRSAQELGITRAALYRRLEKYDL